MTERIYYTDSSCIEFEAMVTRVEARDGRVIAVLDRTAFYPTSGGQPYDTGTIAEAKVVEVTELNDGDIAHTLDGSVSAGQRVRGCIDWPRRFDHMQQHTGQHILSAAFDRLHGARTVGFHLGSASSTIDLDLDLSTGALAAAEAEANRLVWENRPVSVRFADADEASKMALRKEPVKSGPLRLIEVDEFDLSACGGTHVERTGAIGMIAVPSWERFKGGMRVSFLCGQRALHRFRMQRDAIAGSVQRLSVLPETLPDAIGRLQTENKAHLRSLRMLQERISAYEASALTADATRVGRVSVIVKAVADCDAAGLKRLAVELTAQPGCAAALVSETSPALIVIACSKDVALDASAVLRGLTDRFGGRGGGKPGLAQGGGLTGESRHVLDAARHAICSAL